jgi:hypothetical protein
MSDGYLSSFSWMWTILCLQTTAFKTTSEHLEREFGTACRDVRKMLEAPLELGYRNYLGALQRYQIEHPTDIRLLGMSSYLPTGRSTITRTVEIGSVLMYHEACGMKVLA